MAIKKILTYPDPVLRKKAEAVTSFDDDLKRLAADLAETMYNAPGAGLAANQIGVSRRVVVIDITSREEDEEGNKIENTAPKEYLVLVNPEILDCQGSQSGEEGCLSVIDLTAKVKRFQKVTVRAQDIEGKSQEFEAEDFFARVIQHELDHLNGTLFIDHLSSLKRTLYKKRLKKYLLEQQEDHD